VRSSGGDRSNVVAFCIRLVEDFNEVHFPLHHAEQHHFQPLNITCSQYGAVFFEILLCLQQTAQIFSRDILRDWMQCALGGLAYVRIGRLRTTCSTRAKRTSSTPAASRLTP
jgi:hypothetical protein